MESEERGKANSIRTERGAFYIVLRFAIGPSIVKSRPLTI